MTPRLVTDDEARQAVDVARRHGTTVAAEWLGISTFTMRTIRRQLDPDYQRGRGAPTVAEREQAKPSPWCPCERCRGHYRTLRIKDQQRFHTRRDIPPSDEPTWMDAANCRGMDPDVWFPARGESLTRQKAICAACTVREQCLDYALTHALKSGVWGGKSERERRRLRRERNRQDRAS